MPEEDWLQIKAIAAEKGMSVNSYINILLSRAGFGWPKDEGEEKKMSIWDLPKLAKMDKSLDENDGLSEDDKIIYG